MDRLIKGYRAFMANRWPQEQAHYAELSKGQNPEYLVIACSDSRADPATIFGAGPGELFVIRNVAAIVPPYEESVGYHHGTSSALAFGVLHLNVKYILVMGHAQCGGVAAARDMAVADNTPFLGSWIKLLEPAAEKCRHSSQIELERETIKLSLERLMTFPFIAERVKAGTLTLIGARFGIADGQLELLDPATGTFEIVPPQ
ncbi:MAG TPA: carbonic anhydrase [Rhizomicrobium sp.]|nr:carbonic anhydrase [Rhizomicrobium sp.]